jgi:hypothetical protein
MQLCLVLKIMCSHIICLSATLKANEIKFPIEAMNIPIGQNRRRDRPSETKPALKNKIIMMRLLMCH